MNEVYLHDIDQYFFQLILYLPCKISFLPNSVKEYLHIDASRFYNKTENAYDMFVMQHSQ